MSAADPNEGDSTESFVDVCECEDGPEQVPESSGKAKSPEEAEKPAEADREEEESWETVPEHEKDSQEDAGLRKENGGSSPDPEEHNHNLDHRGEPGDVLEATNEGGQKENSHHPQRSAREETQPTTYEGQRECDEPLETTEETQLSNQEETTAESQPSNPEETTSQSEPSRPEETTAQSEPSGPEDTTAQGEPSRPEETTAQGEPSRPEETTAQGEPSRPEETTAQGEPSRPEETTAQGEPSRPEETTAQGEPSRPEETTAQGEPSRPEETTAQGEPSRPEETTAQGEPSRPEETTAQGEPSRPEETTAQGEPSRPEETTAQGEPSRPEETTAQGEPSRPEETTAQSEPSRPEETTAQSEPSRPEETTAQSELYKPEDTTAQSEPSKPEGTTAQSEPSRPEETASHSESPRPEETTAQSEPSKPQEATAGQPEEYENPKNEARHEGEQVESEKVHSQEKQGKSQYVEAEQKAEPAQCMMAPGAGEVTHQCPAPAEALWTVHMDRAVTLKMEESGRCSASPLTVPELFAQAVLKFGQRVALCVQRGGSWEEITYLQYEEQCRRVARGLLRLGLARFSGVLILGRSSPRWFFAHIGAIMAGGVAVVIDPSSAGSLCLGVMLESRAQVLMVEDAQQLRKILEVRGGASGVTAIVQWEGEVEEPHHQVYTWEELMGFGLEVEELRLHRMFSQQIPAECCAAVYGSLEGPRGVLISHDNVTWTCGALAESLALGSQERALSYLPPGHMTVLMFDLWLPLCCGGTTYFVESCDLKGSLISALKAVHPTFFLGPPQFWEMVRRKWTSVERKATPVQRKVLRWAQGKGLQACSGSGPLPWGYLLAERLVFRPARRALGLDRCVPCYVGARPLPRDMAEYYGSLGMDLLDLCEGNETSGVRRCEELAGCRSWLSRAGGWRLWGRHVFMGYLRGEKRTRRGTDEHITPDLRDEEPGDHSKGMMKSGWREDVDVYMEL